MRGKKSDVQPKDRIMRSAKKEFSERGFSGARMSKIAKNAGVNKALIHYYFKDKETLYLEVLRKFFRGSETSESLPEYLGTWNLTSSQKLYIIIYFTVNIFLKATDPDMYRIIFWEMAEGKRYLDSLMLEYSIPRQKVLVSVVREGIAGGEFETDYPLLASMNIGTFIANYAIQKEVHRGKTLFRELYGGSDDRDVFNFVLENVFKSLRPKDRKLEIPQIPDELKKLLDELLAVLVRKKDEGVNVEVFRRIETILKNDSK
jgi:TetR/AcrR family transcriptional regulator